MDRHQVRRVALRPRDRRRSRLLPRAHEKVEVRCRRLSRALAQRGGSIEDQPFGAGNIVVGVISFVLVLPTPALGIGGGSVVGKAGAPRVYRKWGGGGPGVRRGRGA